MVVKSRQILVCDKVKVIFKLNKAKLIWGQMVEASECIFRQFELSRSRTGVDHRVAG